MLILHEDGVNYLYAFANGEKIFETEIYFNGIGSIRLYNEGIPESVITSAHYPKPTSADNGKYLGCENGAATWKPVEELKGADGKSAYQYAKDGGYTGTETEFAEKLAAEKFANPNALTFTGAVAGSYNGSEAMTVEIPSAVTDDHINELINTALNAIGVAEEGAY